MESWYYWVMAGLLFIIIEITTTGFAFFCLFIASIAGALVAGLDYNLKIQLLWFSVTALISFITIRPLLLKYLFKNKKDTPSNTQAIIGRIAIVSEEINPIQNSGRIIIDGDNWKAVTSNKQIINVNEQVRITNIDSIILTVEEIN